MEKTRNFTRTACYTAAAHEYLGNMQRAKLYYWIGSYSWNLPEINFSPIKKDKIDELIREFPEWMEKGKDLTQKETPDAYEFIEGLAEGADVDFDSVKEKAGIITDNECSDFRSKADKLLQAIGSNDSPYEILHIVQDWRSRIE
jgi:hypothetical protein